MVSIDDAIGSYLSECTFQRGLSDKTLKAYGADLKQCSKFFGKLTKIDKENIRRYLEYLHGLYKPRTIKRKLASLKSFVHYAEEEGLIETNPFPMLRISIREPHILPKSLSIREINDLLSSAYTSLQDKDKMSFSYRCILRDATVLELLFVSGARVSEICNLRNRDVDLIDGSMLIYGKGSKERIIHIGNKEVLNILWEYYGLFENEIRAEQKFILNNRMKGISDQSVRVIVSKYAEMAEIQKHVTPHTLRHSLATLLLEEEVDIRYIQSVLGHSSISTTQIYTHVSSVKQKYILTEKHPRNRLGMNNG